MRTNLEEILRGESLRSEIYRTLTAKKLHTLSPLLRNAPHRPLSAHSIFRSQLDSPDLTTHLSVPRLSPSPPSRTHSRSRHRRSAEHPRHQPPRPSQALFGSCSRSKKRQVYLRSLTLQAEQSRSKSRSEGKKKKAEGKKGRSKESGERMGNKKEKGKEKGKERKGQGSKSKSERDNNLNLSSIMEQSSSEQKLATPRSREAKEKSRKRAAQQDRTRKKDSTDYLSDSLRKRLERSFKEPEVFQRILRTDSINVKFRILRRRLLEIEIQTPRMVQELTVTLEKGNLQCQNIQEHYQALQPNSTVSLFTSVREIAVDEPFRMPKLLIEVTLPQQVKLQRAITLPYCWLHFTDDPSKQPQKSRIKTKICLENVAISHRGLRYLGRVLPGWQCRSSKSETVYESRFGVGGCDYELEIYGGCSRWNVELSGRGEERLTRLIEYFSELLC